MTGGHRPTGSKIPPEKQSAEDILRGLGVDV